MVKNYISCARSRLTIQYRLSEVIHGLRSGPYGKLAQQAVNNFAANRAATDIGLAFGFQFRYRFVWFSRPGGPGLLTSSRANDFELMDRPVGRGLTL